MLIFSLLSLIIHQSPLHLTLWFPAFILATAASSHVAEQLLAHSPAALSDHVDGFQKPIDFEQDPDLVLHVRPRLKEPCSRSPPSRRR